MSDVPEKKALRRRNILLAVVLGLLALGFYVGFYVIVGSN